jgi:hypothetical protein
MAKQESPKHATHDAGGRRPGKTEYNVSAEQFITVWQTSDTAQEAAERLKMPKDIAHARASMYRKAGVRLKRMPRRGQGGLNVAALNKLIEELDRQRAEGKKE